MATKGIPGLGVAMATAGGFLMFVGIKDVPVKDGLREFLTGAVPEGKTAEPSAFRTMAQQALYSGSIGGGSSGGSGAYAASLGSGVNSNIARDAMEFLGVPYVFGGASPAGFDCSGLVQWVLRENGVKIGRTTYQQEPNKTVLVTIPRAQLAAGDLVFWPGHVAIAISNTEVVHAPGTGKVVKTSPLASAGPRGLSPTRYARVRSTGANGGTTGGKSATTPPKSAWT